MVWRCGGRGAAGGGAVWWRWGVGWRAAVWGGAPGFIFPHMHHTHAPNSFISSVNLPCGSPFHVLGLLMSAQNKTHQGTTIVLTISFPSSSDRVFPITWHTSPFAVTLFWLTTAP